MNKLTLIIEVVILHQLQLRVPKVVQPEICNLQHPPAVYQTVRRAQVSMRTNLALVQVYHALRAGM